MILLTLLLALAQDPKLLQEYLHAECAKKFDERRREVAALKTPEDVKRRQDRLREAFVSALGGFPEKTPLNARVVGGVKGDGFRVDNVVFESRPAHHVTANLYLPEGTGPFPGVLLPCGHSDKGKAEEAYQRVAILLAKNGLAVLCYDPIGQGERMQLLGADGRPAIKGNTTEHTMAGIGALLVGGSCASFRIWDGIRALDYLQSRPEIDPKKLGCTGNSGGGTLTAYLMALDDRVAVAAPSCYITTLERLFATIGPQDAEQNITGQVAFGMEQTDYVTMRGPKPTLICTGTQDFFDIQGSWTTFREAKQIYAILGHAERVDLIEYNDKHGFSKPRREAATRWMRRWLLGRDDAVVEPELTVFPEAALRCTATGQVLSEFKGKSVFDLNVERADALAKSRGKLEPLTVQKRIGYRATAGRREGDALLVEPGIRLPIVAAASLQFGKDGVDPRGWGATAPADRSPFGADWKEAFLSIHLARPLPGQRVGDVLAARAVLGGGACSAKGPAALVALHAAAIDASIPELTLEGGLLSWDSVVRTPVTRDLLSSVVPGALIDYDLPDLAALMAPRKLSILAPVDAAGKPVSQAALDAAYAAAREAYRKAGVPENLVLRAAF